MFKSAASLTNLAIPILVTIVSRLPLWSAVDFASCSKKTYKAFMTDFHWKQRAIRRFHTPEGESMDKNQFLKLTQGSRMFLLDYNGPRLRKEPFEANSPFDICFAPFFDFTLKEIIFFEWSDLSEGTLCEYLSVLGVLFYFERWDLVEPALKWLKINPNGWCHKSNWNSGSSCADTMAYALERGAPFNVLSAVVENGFDVKKSKGSQRSGYSSHDKSIYELSQNRKDAAEVLLLFNRSQDLLVLPRDNKKGKNSCLMF